jgi:hypothetical protein
VGDEPQQVRAINRRMTEPFAIAVAMRITVFIVLSWEVEVIAFLRIRSRDTTTEHH